MAVFPAAFWCQVSRPLSVEAPLVCPAKSIMVVVPPWAAGRVYAGLGGDASGTPFYGPYDAQELLTEHQEELCVEIVTFRLMVYVQDRSEYMPIDEVPEGLETKSISGTELRERLADGRDIPDWFTFPDVERELRRSHPPRHRQGFTVFFTGLSGSGKSTIANVLQVKLLEMGGRPVTVVDGGLVRRNLS